MNLSFGCLEQQEMKEVRHVYRCADYSVHVFYTEKANLAEESSLFGFGLFWLHK